MKTTAPETNRERRYMTIRGTVQGVGFRPFVYRLATELQLAGWVTNTSDGVAIDVEGDTTCLIEFDRRLRHGGPPNATIDSVSATRLDLLGREHFEVHHSKGGGIKTALVLPDLATCPDCLAEINDPANRRYRYPFINCTNCGPRFSIIEALPYDRANTTMRGFVMCDACRAEYENPADRRFHAQPNACPECGPQLALWDRSGRRLIAGGGPLKRAASLIREGKIVAVKGLGGFHLIVDATNDDTVRTLRARKHREEKPLAIMYPSLGMAAADCEIDECERALLLSQQSPIVLLRRRTTDQCAIAPSVAPGNPCFGVMLPYTPLHHLLLSELDGPVVATSGNLSDEPICTDEHEALRRLGSIADAFLIHDRPIARPVDDSVCRVIMGEMMMIRRARGYAPLPIRLPRRMTPTLAVGAHLKNTIAAVVEDNAFISQHVGDLDTAETLASFEATIESFARLYEFEPRCVAADQHPDYLSTQYARLAGKPIATVQHHVAHIHSCMADNGLDGPVLGISWDGTGYGEDGTIWGGEFFTIDGPSYERIAHLRPFPLPGGEIAIREPRRAAIGLLHEIGGEQAFDLTHLPTITAFSAEEISVLRTMLRSKLNSPHTSSVGRLFDAVSSLLGIRQVTRYEGQAAMELEFAADTERGDLLHTLNVVDRDGTLVLDWEPLIRAMLDERSTGVPVALISARFHCALIGGIVEIARRIGRHRVVLSGGCFQNRLLLEGAIRRLRANGFAPYWHHRVPPNDGGIALGQLVYAMHTQE